MNPKFILVDEGDFLPKFQQDDVRHVAERYIAKSDPFIVMVSTPNAPGGLFQKIEQEPFDTCIYKKIFLDYTYGLDKIYTKAEIEKARVSPSFPREYELQYLGLIGNVLSQLSIANATKIEYNPENISLGLSLEPSVYIAKVTEDVDRVALCLYRFSKFFWLNGSVYSVYRYSCGLIPASPHTFLKHCFHSLGLSF